MSIRTKLPDKGDPSDILQEFPYFNIQILCCRYWCLKNWEFNELSYPYWRIYHNINDVASMYFNGKKYKITEDKLVLIAPNTAYSTKLFNHYIPKEGYNFKGNRVVRKLANEWLKVEKMVLHLFIHFNLGNIYDNVRPGIYMLVIDEHMRRKIVLIKDFIIHNHIEIDFQTTLIIKSLITDLLSRIPKSEWELPSRDHRVLATINHINNHQTADLSNKALAERLKLTPNSFHRLFTSEIGISPQKYIRKAKIDKACILLHHSEKSIEQIAMECGFADRYHFSRIFNQITNTSPARYRKYLETKE